MHLGLACRCPYGWLQQLGMEGYSTCFPTDLWGATRKGYGRLEAQTYCIDQHTGINKINSVTCTGECPKEGHRDDVETKVSPMRKGWEVQPFSLEKRRPGGVSSMSIKIWREGAGDRTKFFSVVLCGRTGGNEQKQKHGKSHPNITNHFD